MKTVGIRNLKDSLSRYIKLARDGERILVTDHDRIVAEIVPASGAAHASELMENYLNSQAELGLVTRATKKTQLTHKRKGSHDQKRIRQLYNETRSDRR